jgi:hypothetical protein
MLASVVDIGTGYSREECDAISGRRRSRTAATITRASDRVEEGHVSGKVRGLFYDCFGDFEGFDLEDCDECHHFKAHERPLEEVIRRACHERTWVTVSFDRSSRRIRGIVIECTRHRSKGVEMHCRSGKS